MKNKFTLNHSLKGVDRGVDFSYFIHVQKVEGGEFRNSDYLHFIFLPSLSSIGRS